MAKKDLVKQLVRLFGDPSHLAKLQADPDAALAKSALSAKERSLLLSGDDGAIHAYLGDEAAKANIKTKTSAANIKTKTPVANIKTKTSAANIKTKTKK